MSKPINIFRSAKGLHTRMDSVRLPVDFETGQTFLTAAVNVDIDDTGRVSRRKGFTIRNASAKHSLFCDGGDCLFVSGTTLYRLNADYSATSLRTGLTSGAKMAHVQVNDEIYYSNGFEKGVIRDGLDTTWTAGAYVGPTTTKTFQAPPAGTILELYYGRLYVVQGNIVWYSEPFAYSWFDLSKNYLPFSSRVQMFKAVKGGIYASDEDRTFFLAGDNPREFQREVVAEYPAILGTAVLAPGNILGSGEKGERVALWLSQKGICLGVPGGAFQNLTERNLVLPGGNFGAGLYMDGKYIATLQP